MTHDSCVQAVGVLYPDLSGAMRTFRLTGGITHDQRRNTEEGEGLIQGQGVDPIKAK